MSPVTHFLMGWAVGALLLPTRRERGLVALAGVAPDFDGVGLVADLATRNSAEPTELWAAWHHVVGHGLLAALVVAIGCAVFARSARLTTGLLALVSFHLHILGDIVGARGPEGEQWPIHYLWPFAAVELTWSGQWALNAWPNLALTVALIAFTMFVAWRTARSPLEMLSVKANARFVDTLRARWGVPPA